MAFGNGPRIVTNGLVLSLDAADQNSYVSGSATWYDLSGNGNNGNISSSVLYNSSNGNNLGFIGNGAVLFPENSALNTQTPTVEVWAKTNALSQLGFWFEKGNVNTQYSLFQENANILWRQYLTEQGTYRWISVTTATYINTTNWFQVAGTYTSGVRCLYINGVLVNSDTQTGTIPTNPNGMSVGAYGGFNGTVGGRGYYYNGNIGTVKVYNRALSAAEIAQNYNAQKSRFNLK